MIKPCSALMLAFALAVAPVAGVRAQDSSTSKALLIPIKVQLVISRFQGEKKISALPYTLSINATSDPRNAGRGTLRMGVKVPIMMMAPPTVDGKPIKDVPVAGPIQYQDVGTNIDCFVAALDDGRFKLDITVDDSSVYPDDKSVAGTSNGNPSFRSFRVSDQMVLKDGATAQFTAATDKVSGEVVKVDVTLTVVK